VGTQRVEDRATLEPRSASSDPMGGRAVIQAPLRRAGGASTDSATSLPPRRRAGSRPRACRLGQRPRLARDARRAPPRTTDGPHPVRRPSAPDRYPWHRLAGVVEAVGDDVTAWQPGDAVFGEGIGTFADYAVASAEQLAALPAGTSLHEAAALPLAATTALLCLDEAALGRDVRQREIAERCASWPDVPSAVPTCRETRPGRARPSATGARFHDRRGCWARSAGGRPASCIAPGSGAAQLTHLAESAFLPLLYHQLHSTAVSPACPTKGWF
jgi:hypothetical protein